ncbi:ABC transporter ATP-binding protein, partial [bacterium]|nr:ABC transporter ATP-binding protein [bacterium]
SGSGKTTLMNLIAGILDDYQGEIKVNSRPLSQINKESWHKTTAYITQEPVVFDDTIANNITFWDDLSVEGNKERYERALKQASLWTFVQSLPEGNDTLIGYHGVKVSGGQKQRISIARELYRRNINLVLLDEATSSLDSETERNVQIGLEALSKDHISLIIAHRLTTIKNADKIVLLNKGKIETIGTFSQLNESNQRFKEMVELQEF